MSTMKADTPWRTSASGNLWRISNGRHLVVGKRRYGTGFWAICDGLYIKEPLATEEAAKSAANVQALLGLLG